MIKLCCFLVCLLSLSALFAQNLDQNKAELIEQRIDFLSELNATEEIDFNLLFERLETFYNYPINLNKTDKEELKSLSLFNDIQIHNLLLHIQKNGELISIEELQSIEGFQTENIKLIMPFIEIKHSLRQNTLSLNQLLREGSSSLIIRHKRVLEKQEGYKNSNEHAQYLGSPDKLFSRYQFAYRNQISMGITAEKDEGEQFFKGSQKSGFDYYSMHFFVQNVGKIRQLALGDYQVQFGQGLTFWSGLAFGRSASIFSLKRNPQKIRPYKSVQENQFLRGGALSFGNKNIQTTLFYSNKKQDANRLGVDPISGKTIISSLPLGGFHRTAEELADKNAIRNEFIGGNLSYERKNLSLGLTAVYNEIQAILQADQTPYNQFNSLDNRNIVYGFDFSYLYKNWVFFGETSQSDNKGKAYTIGALAIIDPKLSLGIQYRNFEPYFKPIQSNALSENSRNTNEKGVFIGIESQFHRNLNFSAYVDQFAFDWLKFNANAPSRGSNSFAQLNYKPNKRTQLYFRFRNNIKSKNDNSELPIERLVPERLRAYRFHFSYQVTKNIQVRNRIEFNRYQLGENSLQKGFLIFQDVSFKKMESPFSFTIRYLNFDTDSYNSRIYTYENDVLFAYTIPAFSGSGMRFYLISKWHIGRNVDFWIRYAQTYFSDRNEIGDGKEKIIGNTKSEIKTQLRIKF